MNPRLTLNSDRFDWASQAAQLPAQVVINGTTIETSSLGDEAKHLLAVYLVDQQIVGQQEEILSLAKLGLIELGNRILSSHP